MIWFVVKMPKNANVAVPELPLVDQFSDEAVARASAEKACTTLHDWKVYVCKCDEMYKAAPTIVKV